VQTFLGTVGLPSNALWFDASTSAIMCFDGVAILRNLTGDDVSARAWGAITPLGPLIVLGNYATAFVVCDRRGQVLIIGSDKHRRIPQDPDWRANFFVNQSPRHFAECLIAYKTLVEAIKQNQYDFGSPAIRQAVYCFRGALDVADELALSDPQGYWAQILGHLDVW
jgi:hypothetical protein